MRFLNHAASTLTRWTPYGTLNSTGINIPSAVLDGVAGPADFVMRADHLRYYHDRAFNLVMKYAAENPYDWNVPRPLDLRLGAGGAEADTGWERRNSLNFAPHHPRSWCRVNMTDTVKSDCRSGQYDMYSNRSASASLNNFWNSSGCSDMLSRISNTRPSCTVCGTRLAPTA